jgi:hypothetical protein
VSVLANGSTEPALRIGFSQISFGPQDPALFTFTPGPGVTVVRLPVPPAGLSPDNPSSATDPADPVDPSGPTAARPELAGTALPPATLDEPAAPGQPATGRAAPGARAASDSALIGRGWDTVLVRRVRPSNTLLAAASRRTGTADPGRRSEVDLLQRISSPISGPWGKGRLVSTPIGNAVITTDGRMATGAVPAQVLTEALSDR